MYKSPDGWSIYPTDWSVNSFVKMCNRNQIDFNSRVQRGFVWTKKKSSLYIHSLLYGMLDYHMPFLLSKHDDIYYSIDGKQRGITIAKYVNNEYALVGLKNEPINLDGITYNINGKYFKQLPEILQDKILDFMINVVYLEDAPAEIETMFFERANGGVAVSKVDIALSKSISIDEIMELSKHEIFTVMFTKSRLEKNPQKEIIVKSYIALNETEPDFSVKHFNSLMSDLVIDNDDKMILSSAFDMILGAYKYVFIENKDISNKMLDKTQFLTYIMFVDRFKDSKQLANWIVKFYSDLSDEYVNASSKHTTEKTQINKRVAIVERNIEKFLAEKE